MAPIEPWPGYTRDSETKRLARLNFKVDEARLRWDLLYAHAVAAAVVNYESLDRGGAGAPGKVEKAAEKHVTEIAKMGDWGFEEAGGWGHG
jgi:hypothetical protein